MRIFLMGDDVLSNGDLKKYLDESFLKAEIYPCLWEAPVTESTRAEPGMIVISHMNLPGKEDGLNVLKKFKADNPRACTILIVRLSLYENLEAAVKQQVDWVIEPPLSEGKFRSLLRKVFRELEDRSDKARRQEVFHQINSSLIKSSEKESALRPRAPA